MISFFPTGYVATATRGNLDGIYRMLPYGGAFAGGEGGWSTGHFAISWDFISSGALAGGIANYPPRFGFPASGGMIVGGKAYYPTRHTTTDGMVASGAAIYPFRFSAFGGAVASRAHAVVGETDWRFHIGFPGTYPSGAVIGGVLPITYRDLAGARMTIAEQTFSALVFTDTTKKFIMTEV
jgi:hypothetical protein